MGNKSSKKETKGNKIYNTLNINVNNSNKLLNCYNIKLHNNIVYLYFKCNSFNITSLLNKSITLTLVQNENEIDMEVSSILIQGYSTNLIKIDGKNKYQLTYQTSKNNTIYIRYDNIKTKQLEFVYMLKNNK